MADVTISKTRIPDLLHIDLTVHGDNRGWFKENYQAAKLREAGFPDFEPVQNNFSFNAEVGVTRGIHAEPWEKYISLATGRCFAAIVDLRPGDSFGTLETFELTPGNAIFVPRDCGNSFQTLEPNVVYTYLVNAH
jgi:dTDP-4-dehydrorhamnose 3,5-epimerase